MVPEARAMIGRGSDAGEGDGAMALEFIRRATDWSTQPFRSALLQSCVLTSRQADS